MPLETGLTRKRLLAHVNRTVNRHGRVYFYHRKTGANLNIIEDGEKTDRLDEAKTAAINIALANEAAGASMRHGPGTMGALLEHYKAKGMGHLAPATIIDYRRTIDLLETDEMAARPVRAITSETVLEFREIFEDTPRAAEKHVAAFSAILTFARQRPSRYGLEYNPAHGLEKIKRRKKSYLAWPSSLIDEARARAYPELRLIVDGLLYLGQRPGDTCALNLSQYDGAAWAIEQSKTGKYLIIPAHPKLISSLSNIDREIGPAFVTKTGRRWTPNWLDREIKLLVESCGKAGYTPHGLGKNAIRSLFEAGCTEKEVEAATGKSAEMVTHYAKGFNQVLLARRAIAKLSRNKNRTGTANPKD